MARGKAQTWRLSQVSGEILKKITWGHWKFIQQKLWDNAEKTNLTQTMKALSTTKSTNLHDLRRKKWPFFMYFLPPYFFLNNQNINWLKSKSLPLAVGKVSLIWSTVTSDRKKIRSGFWFHTVSSLPFHVNIPVLYGEKCVQPQVRHFSHSPLGSKEANSRKWDTRSRWPGTLGSMHLWAGGEPGPLSSSTSFTWACVLLWGLGGHGRL